MPVFPLRKRPAESYKVAPRAFGGPRDNGKRKHAGCDLYAPVGSDILAIDDGVVVTAPYPFYAGTYAMEIHHPTIGIVRYSEFTNPQGILVRGARVTCGQVLAKVGKLIGIKQSMLHLELFKGTGHGPLTDKSKLPFMRRDDLVDPAALLDSLPAENEKE